MKVTEQRKLLFFTVLSNLTLQCVTALCGFILPPLIIREFGSTVNGMVSSITQCIAYLNLVEAGVGGAAIAALYKPLAEHNCDRCNAILSATKRFYNRSGLIFTLLIFTLSFVYPFFVGDQISRFDAAFMVLILGISGVAEFFLIGKYRVLLTADRHTYVLSIIQIFAVICNTAVSVFLIRCGGGILVVKLCASVVYLCRYLFIAVYVRKRYRQMRFDKNPDVLAISQSKNVMVHQVGSLIVRNSPVLIITIFCTLKDVSVYSVYAMVFFAIKQILLSFSNGIEAFLGNSLVKNSLKVTHQNFSHYETLFFALVFWVYVLALLLCIPFMRLYTRTMTDAEYIQPLAAFLFVVVGVFDHLRTPGDKLISAAGHFKQTQFRSLLEAGINLVCSIIFTLFFGWKGVLLGSVCSYLYRSFDIIFYASRHILRIFPVASLTKFLCFLVLSFLVYRGFSVWNLQMQTYMQWILSALLFGIIAATVFFVPVMISFRFSARKKQW